MAVSIRVVLFDLDDTLLDHRGAVATAIVAHRGEVLPPSRATDAEEASRWHELEEHHYHRYLAGQIDFRGQRRARARDFMAPYGVALADDDAADAWWDVYSARYVDAWRLHEDVLPCLDALADLPLGIVTNGDPVAQSRKLETIGLDSRFQHLTTSGGLGVAKPDPQIFHHACAEFGVDPAEAAYVGDRLQTDAVGAADAGLLGVWIARAAPSPEQLAEASTAGARAIRTLADLPALLR